MLLLLLLVMVLILLRVFPRFLTGEPVGGCTAVPKA